jgi:hypothetical protein
MFVRAHISISLQRALSGCATSGSTEALGAGQAMVTYRTEFCQHWTGCRNCSRPPVDSD